MDRLHALRDRTSSKPEGFRTRKREMGQSVPSLFSCRNVHERIRTSGAKMVDTNGSVVILKKSQGIRDEGLLDSALSVPFQEFGGVSAYPTIEHTHHSPGAPACPSAPPSVELLV